VNLPVDWLPESVTNAMAGLLQVLGMAFGRPASVDCLLQAWGVWQNDTMGDIIQKTFFRAFFRCAAALYACSELGSQVHTTCASSITR